MTRGAQGMTERWNALEIAELLGWRVGGWLEDAAPLGPVQIDTRAIVPVVPGDGAALGELFDGGAVTGAPIFAALQGPGGHGANFWAEAVRRGAGALLFGDDADDHVVSEATAEARVPVIVADCDGWTALGELGHAWRRRCEFTVVGITGSTGKTSTKDLLATLLAPLRRTHASPANHNNELGVPLTLLAAGPKIEVVICEMGMRGRGQIAYLCEVAAPDVGVLTNVGSAHLELLGSLEAIAAAKAEIIAGTKLGGTAVVPAVQQRMLLDLAARSGSGSNADGAGVDADDNVGDPGGDGGAGARLPAHVRTFASPGDGADLRADPALPRDGTTERRADVEVLCAERTAAGIAGTLRRGSSEVAFALPVHGLHNARNLATAVAAAWSVLGDDEVALLDLSPHQLALGAGRGQRTALASGGVVIDDAYNANPESVAAALGELAAVSVPGQRTALLGYMAELGPGEIGMHVTAGEQLAQLDIDQLVAITDRPAVSALVLRWEELSGRRATTYASVEAAVASLDAWSSPRDAILVKASNSVGLGRCAQALVERYRLTASTYGVDHGGAPAPAATVTTPPDRGDLA